MVSSAPDKECDTTKFKVKGPKDKYMTDAPAEPVIKRREVT